MTHCRKFVYREERLRKTPGAAETMLKIELEQDADGRWVAETPALAGVLAYGRTREEAIASVEALALRVLADRLEHGEAISRPSGSLATG